MKNTIKFILLLLNDIYWIFKISKEEFFDIVEILSLKLNMIKKVVFINCCIRTKSL